MPKPILYFLIHSFDSYCHERVDLVRAIVLGNGCPICLAKDQRSRIMIGLTEVLTLSVVAAL